MFYPPPQFAVTYADQYPYQQEEQQRLNELIYKQQLIHNQSILLSTPPPSPMATALGHPNRSCASCKKRKVKCDRKTPSCTACQKSKHRCQYTSYSPQVLTEGFQQPDEDVKLKVEDNRMRWTGIQKMMPVYQTPMPIKDEFADSANSYYNIEDEEIYLNNHVLPTTSAGTTPQFAHHQHHQHQQQQHHHQQQQQQQLRLSPQQQIQMAQQQQQQQQQVTYILPPQQYHQQNSSEASTFVQAQNVVVPPGNNYSPYLKGIVVLNYNLNGMAPLLGRPMAPILQSVSTSGYGPNIPQTGFVDVCHLQAWLREKFLSQGQDWKEETESYGDSDDRLELRPIYEEVNQQSFIVQQKFEVILHRADVSSSSPSSGNFQSYDFDETGSNRSSVTDLDPTDAFLNKIYAFVRRFIRNHPWLRDNFMSNLRAKTSQTLGLETFSDGVFSDVIVEVRKFSPYSPYQQDLKLIPNQEEFVKGRLFF